ncbi:MAG: DMT family transporter [Oscillospiraceae bacterium]|nr:DMT family transporter [Oscillospiraceae bacterium]
MKQTKTTSSLMLLLTALIWGSAFVAQSAGMAYVGPFTFNTLRNLIGGFVLIPSIALLDRLNKKSPGIWGDGAKQNKKDLLLGGVLCGVVLAVAGSLQQIGIVYTTVGKAGFITALYIIIVPILGIFLGKKVQPMVWASVGIATVGMYLLCITESFSISKGDFFVVLCALAFSVHILIIDHFTQKVDGVRMSCIQFLVAGILCAFPAMAIEQPSFPMIMGQGPAIVSILYAGVMSSGVAYTLQVVGQKGINPAVASLILSLESVFAVLCGWLILGQQLTARELLGCAFVFCAIILAQLPDFLKSKRKASR